MLNEVHKLNKKVTHTLCLCRQNDNDNYEILTPCGVCQERLYYWGLNVNVLYLQKIIQ